jgi:hypothetical protein
MEEILHSVQNDKSGGFRMTKTKSQDWHKSEGFRMTKAEDLE